MFTTRFSTARRAPASRHAWLLTAVAVAVLSACGGGGGGDSTATTPETPQAVTDPNAAVAVDAVVRSSQAYLFEATTGTSTEAQLASATGGATYASWNPVGSPTFFAPGMKVSFFGDPAGCASGTKSGTVDAASATTAAHVQQLTGLARASEALSWAPSGNSSGCSGVADRKGPSTVYLHGGDNAGLALYTAAGPRTDGAGAEFFGTFGAAGQNGLGANANITGSYVAFRSPWRTDTAIRPWKLDNGAGSARIVVNQGVARTEAGSSDSTLSQLQQLFTLHVINRTCLNQTVTQSRPCQLNYLFNSTILRNNVSDWSTVGWAQTVRVWYDAAQGGIPIIEGQIKGSGTASIERDTGLPMFTSRGNPTQHGAHSNRSFDVRISMDQLRNVLTVLTSRQYSVAPSAVTTEQLVAMWGADWNNPDAWVMESITVAQEISSADTSKPAWIAGNVRQVYVGPSGS